VISRGASQTRTPELDGLRGFAILLVLIHHFGPSSISADYGSLVHYALIPFRLTWTGVDLFFVLSGYLIGGILLDVRRSPNYFSTFYVRRALRILPAYYMLLALFVLGLDLQDRGGRSLDWLFQERGNLLDYVFFFQNFWWVDHSQLNWMNSTWSLAIEEQFYLTVPALVRFTPRRVQVGILIGLVLLAPVLRTYLFLYTEHGPEAAYALPWCRMDALALGVLIAFVRRDSRCWSCLMAHKVYVRGAFCALLAPMAFLTLAAPDGFHLLMATGGYSIVAIFYVCLLVFVLVDGSGPAALLMRSATLRNLGMISFGLYLIHIPVLGLAYGLLFNSAPQISQPVHVATSLAALAASVAIATASWKLFENRFVRHAHLLRY
jgi:peptidoglycan/LPS O-acetylase OafA/YrhL